MAMKAFAPYYTNGRRLGLSTATIDAANAAGARASYDAKVVTITYPDGRQIYGKVRVTARGRAAWFVNKFNEKSTTP